MVHDDTYEILRRMGDVTMSFDDVIKKLIQAASGSGSSQGHAGQITATAETYRNSQETVTAK